jgi:hypothetical protein
MEQMICDRDVAGILIESSMVFALDRSGRMHDKKMFSLFHPIAEHHRLRSVTRHSATHRAFGGPQQARRP